MKKASFLFVFLCFGCDEELSFTTYCAEPVECLVSNGGVVVVTDIDSFAVFNPGNNSPCSLGQTQCDPETGDLECIGVRLPDEVGQVEVCDGQDNNCNFVVDEFTGREWFNDQNTCEQNTGACISRQTCIDGVYQCTPMFPDRCRTDEICNGVDDNGDGQIDEDLPPSLDWPEDIPLSQVSFDEPSICSVGVTSCENGRTVTTGLQTPRVELCGNLLDEDCDGLTDEGNSGKRKILFVLDDSGSMHNRETVTPRPPSYFDTVVEAICLLEPEVETTYAAMLFGRGDFPESITIGPDFDSLEKVCEFLRTPSLDREGIEYAGEAIKAAKELTWKTEITNHIMLFTDEPLQGLGGDPNADITLECEENGYHIGVFTSSTWVPSWETERYDCPGFVETLGRDADELRNQIELHLLEGC